MVARPTRGRSSALGASARRQVGATIQPLAELESNLIRKLDERLERQADDDDDDDHEMRQLSASRGERASERQGRLELDTGERPPLACHPLGRPILLNNRNDDNSIGPIGGEQRFHLGRAGRTRKVVPSCWAPI